MNDDSAPVDRRTVLATSALALTGLAGCVTDDVDDGAGSGNDGNGDDENDTNDGNDSNDGNDNSDPSDDPAIESAAIETTGTDCGDPDDDDVTEVALDEDPIRIEGILPAPNPCYEAILKSAAVEDGTLDLTIDVEQDLPDDEECIECHGAVEYAVTIDLAAGVEISDVHVDHVTGGSIGVAYESEQERDSGEESDDGGEPEEDDDPDDDSGVEGSEHEIRDTSIETLDSDCGSASDASVTPESDRIVIDGTIVAGNPCHEAVLVDAAVRDGELRIGIDVESTLEEGEVWIQCVGEIDYRAIVEVTDAKQLASVHVDHVDGGSYGSAWDSASDSERDD